MPVGGRDEGGEETWSYLFNIKLIVGVWCC